MFVINKMVIWVMTGLFSVLTMFFNLYIFLMSLSHYKQNKHWAPCETIITALSVANGAHQLICYFWMTMDVIDIQCRLDQTSNPIVMTLIFSLKFTIMWTTGFLTFYYSTKLVTSPNHCYTKIQDLILRHVTMAVILIPLCGMGCCMPMLAMMLRPGNHTITDNNCGVFILSNSIGTAYEVIYLIMVDVLPGLLTIKCCISISLHLAIHLKHMKASSNGAHCPKFGTQMRVIRMNLFLVGIFLFLLVGDIYVHYKMAVNQVDAIALTFLFMSIYTTASAIVLIYGKKTFWKALLHGYNACLDEYPCVTCLKVSEKKSKPTSAAENKH